MPLPVLRALVLALGGAAFTPHAIAQDEPLPIIRFDLSGKRVIPPGYACAYRPSSFWVRAYRDAIAAGLVADPAQRAPVVPARVSQYLGPPDPAPCLTREQIFAFEDTSGVLQTNFTLTQLFTLQAQAFNAMIAAHGDLYDFAGFFLNYTPHHQIGLAFNLTLFNDVTGLGNSTFDDRAALGVGASSRIQSWVMMWRLSDWVAGTDPTADFTRLVLAHEFEHRFGMFLPNLLDGRALQGTTGCGQPWHWNWRVDGQGSAMEISEWVGASPATLAGSFVNFNADIPGGAYSYTDLYLMGYVSPAEMDAGNSELRYMDTSDCSPSYGGAISHFSSADVAAAAGPRVPDSTSAQKHFRTGWILLHLPGSPPTDAELDLAVAILAQRQLDWSHSTLGRGTMNDTLFDDCNCNGVPDAAEIAGGAADLDRDGVPDECQPPGVAFCNGADGAHASCPCGNAGDPGAGCDVAQGTGGVLLEVGAQGTVPQNSATLLGSGFPPAGFPAAILLRSASVDPAAPVVFGDGLRCIGTPLVRLAATFAAGGGSTHAFGHSAMAGAGTFFYQLWFRNQPIGFCDPAAAFNLSNAHTLAW